jgi:hypothetical protein
MTGTLTGRDWPGVAISGATVCMKNEGLYASGTANSQ